MFVPWTEIDHPDFPGKVIEAGGIKPFAMINPPADTLDALISKNYKFLTTVAAMHPDLEFLDVCLLYTSPSPRDRTRSRMPSTA